MYAYVRIIHSIYIIYEESSSTEKVLSIMWKNSSLINVDDMTTHALCCTVQYSTKQYSTVQYSTKQYSTVQYSTVQYSAVQYITVKYNTVQYGTTHHSLTSLPVTTKFFVSFRVDLWRKKNK